MSGGRLIAVVGPSGVGKDSVIAALSVQMPSLTVVRRTTTRKAGLGGEEYEPVSREVFEQMARDGAFCLHWRAHELRYGLPQEVLEEVQNGAHCIANLSRNALKAAAEIFPSVVVINLTARPDTLARRLHFRGRESERDILRRLEQGAKPLPSGLNVITLENDGPLDRTVASAVQALGRTSVA